MIGPELLSSDDLCDHQVFVQLQQGGVVRQGLPLELWQQLHQLLLDLVPVHHLGSLSTSIHEMKGCAIPIVKNYLELDLGFSLWTDLLGLYLGVLMGHREGALGPWHPSNPLGHDKQDPLILLVLNLAHL